MKRSILIIFAILLAGCVIPTADKNFATINSSVAQFQSYLSTAASAIDAVLPAESPADKVRLENALTAIKAAARLADPISQANDKWKADYAALQSDDAMVRGSFGWRAEVAVKTSIVIAIIVGVVMVVVFPAVTPMLLNAGGIVATLTAHLHAALPLQNLAPLISSLWIKPQTTTPAAEAPAINSMAKTVINSGTMPSASPLVLKSAADAHGLKDDQSS